MTSEALAARLLADGRLFVNPGSIYGAAGRGIHRLNIACRGRCWPTGSND